MSQNNIKPNKSKLSLLLVSLSITALSAPTFAQDTEVVEEVIVSGTRQIIRDAIDIKRSATTIVDGLSASDIGDLPALSIGEALESITGAASHRENGGATEISIRGLGPFLSATTFNGRMVTNGSGDRSVNFSQFPSELMSKLAIYKTQDASLIEGGVAGLIALETLKPLDYGKRRFQVGLKGNYNPDQQNITDTMAGDIGHRTTLSYVDQFDYNNGSEMGISIGYQKSDISQPEQEMRSSSPSGSSLFACLADNDPFQGYSNITSTNDDCEDNPAGSSNNGAYDSSIDPATGDAVDAGRRYAWAGSSRGYRQNDSQDEREAFFAALQLQPNDRLDINADLQWSERIQTEDRYDLNFANMKRNTRGTTLDSLGFQTNGVVNNWSGETDIDSNGELFKRTEDYIGFGVSAEYQATDRLTVSGDLSYSKTEREELQASFRQQSQSRQDVTFTRAADGFVTWTVEDFDITDPTNFDDGLRVRLDRDTGRENVFKASRIDFNFDTNFAAIDSVDFGMRASEQTYFSPFGTSQLRDTYTTNDANPAVMACARAFPESNFLSSAGAGDLVTDVSNNVGYNSWAIFDNQCRLNAILDANSATLVYPEIETRTSAVDVKEDTLAAYVMANFQTEVSSKPVRGNFGIRVVNTDVTSTGYRRPFEVVTLIDGTLDLQEDTSAALETIVARHDYTEVLPSFNIAMDYSDELVFRAGIFKGMSRADPADMGFTRSFNTDDSADAFDVEDLITGVTAAGNPYADALTSWNFDLAAEWYPNDDSILAVSLYYKDFTGGFTNTVVSEDYVVDGSTITLPVTLSQTNKDTSSLKGIEITASHNFSYLPSFWSGFGTKLSYNKASSDFVFEDSLYGNRGSIGLDGVFTQTHQGIVAPGNIPGFSEDTFSGQVYYGTGPFDVSIIHKYRSEYFQPYTSNGTRLRYVGDVGVWEARASYQLTDNIKLSVDGINLFDEPKSQYFFTNDNLGEVNYYGARYFIGLRGKW